MNLNPLRSGDGKFRGRKRRLDERASRAKAERELGLLAPKAVARLAEILDDPTSTKFDMLGAIEKVLSRVVPAKTQNEMVMKNAPPIAFFVRPDFKWPGANVHEPEDEPDVAPAGNGDEPAGNGDADTAH